MTPPPIVYPPEVTGWAARVEFLTALREALRRAHNRRGAEAVATGDLAAFRAWQSDWHDPRALAIAAELASRSRDIRLADDADLPDADALADAFAGAAGE